MTYGTYELQPIYDNCKSFYNKAHVKIVGDDAKVLYSYNTPVLASENGVLIRLWEGWSATTGRHIKEFCLQESFGALNKNDYINMEVKK